MKLHQISEPEGITVGIDLGTTNSLIGYYDGGVIIIPDQYNEDGMVPSAVLYDEDGIKVGHQALSDADAITSVKRLIGKGINDKIDNHYNLSLENSSDELLKLNTRQGIVSPIEVSGEILKYLKSNAEAYLGKSVTSAVITVPAHFDDAARVATKDAARLAGLEVLRIINEPTAAAIAYGLHTTHGKTILVYDLGGGTFDVSILKNNNGVLMVVATGGDNHLGGDDFDALLAEALANKAQAYANKAQAYANKAQASTQQGIVSPSTITKNELNIACECKKYLSDHDRWTGQFFGEEVTITRDEAIDVWKPLISRTIRTIAEVLFTADMKPDEIDDIVLAGGSTKMLGIKSAVERFFNKEPLSTIDPDKIVVIGATLHANALTDGGSVLVDVVPLSLGLELLGGIVEVIIPRNTSIPIIVKKIFTTYKDNQTGFKIHIVQGEGGTVEKCRSLCRFELKGIPPKPAGQVRLEVIFRVDADGILFVSAIELETGKTHEIQVKPSYGLSEEELLHLLHN